MDFLRHKPSHHSGNGNLSCPQEEMAMVAQQRPPVKGGRILQQESPETTEKVLPIFIVPEDHPPFLENSVPFSVVQNQACYPPKPTLPF